MDRLGPTFLASFSSSSWRRYADFQLGSSSRNFLDSCWFPNLSRLPLAQQLWKVLRQEACLRCSGSIQREAKKLAGHRQAVQKATAWTTSRACQRYLMSFLPPHQRHFIQLRHLDLRWYYYSSLWTHRFRYRRQMDLVGTQYRRCVHGSSFAYFLLAERQVEPVKILRPKDTLSSRNRADLGTFLLLAVSRSCWLYNWTFS